MNENQEASMTFTEFVTSAEERLEATTLLIVSDPSGAKYGILFKKNQPVNMPEDMQEFVKEGGLNNFQAGRAYSLSDLKDGG